MKKASSPIVFFGSGPVAKASLDHLAAHFEIEAVVTKPVTEAEMAYGLADIAGNVVPTYTVANRAELTELMSSKPFLAHLGVIVDFGIIVEQAVIDYFGLGIVNSHFSLLPQWRGADPITFAVLSGQLETGVSLMVINAELDEGELLAQEDLPILPDATTESLTTELVNLSNNMLVRHLPLYMDGKLKPYPQDTTITPTYSRKLTKDDGLLDWAKPAVVLEREVRAFGTWPKSRSIFGDIEVVITKTHVAKVGEAISDLRSNSDQERPGSLLSDKKKHLALVCGEGILVIDELKPAGKGVMPTQAFLAGYAKRLPL